ncbi:acetylornithine/succinyldiaminopimelate transaminase [Vreelandella sp. EE27]
MEQPTLSNRPQTPQREDYARYMTPNYAPQEVMLTHGQGSRLWDQAGREYIDFAGGVAVSGLGHCHPALITALQAQARRVWHLSNVYTNEPALALARALTQRTFADKVFFCSSGNEANEAALKLARRYAYDHFGPQKHTIIAFKQAFHGRSLLTVTAGGQPAYTEGFGPLPQGVVHGEFNDLESVRALIDDATCAVIIEPVQGESGVVPARQDFLEGLRALCNQHQALLIFDEVQTGMGRTGSLYAYMHHHVVPDILTSAKALGGGFPIAAMLTTSSIAASFAVGTHGSTYGGNPLACAVAMAALETIDTPEVLSGVEARHQLMIEQLEAINQQYPVFKEIRGEGLLIGAELSEVYQGRAESLMPLLIREGLIAQMAGAMVLRLTPSLIIPEADIQEGMRRLKRAISILARLSAT